MSYEEPEYLLIVGMHRSGTSMLAHLMCELGYNVGKSPMKPSRDNPEGFFENMAIKRFHDRLLESAGSSWRDPRGIEPDFLRAKVEEDVFFEFASILGKQFAGQSKRLVKDPRMCRLMPFWIGGLGKMGITNFRCLLPIRHPMSVARSLQRRNGFPIFKGLTLWIQNVLSAESDTRGHRRRVTIYDDVLAGKSASTLAGFLDVDEVLLAEAIEQVANPELRHNSPVGHGETDAVEKLAAQVWDALAESAYEKDVDEKLLDGLREEYRMLSLWSED